MIAGASSQPDQSDRILPHAMSRLPPQIAIDDVTCPPKLSLSRRLVVEGLATALLLAVVVGANLMTERVCGGNAGLALLCVSLASGAGLLALLLTFGPLSGAHMNPALTLVLAWRREFSYRDAWPYIAAQLIGAVTGVALAQSMFGSHLLSAATQARTGLAPCIGECVATFGLILVAISCARHKPDVAPFAVAAYIVAGYWFTSSSAFANPALTLARTLCDGAAGIRVADAVGYVIAELLGAAAAALLLDWLMMGEQARS